MKREAAKALLDSSDMATKLMAKHYLEMTEPYERLPKLLAKYKERAAAAGLPIEDWEIESARKMAAGVGCPVDVAHAFLILTVSCPDAEKVLTHINHCNACADMMYIAIINGRISGDTDNT